MTHKDSTSRFSALLQRPKTAGKGSSWAFVVLPTKVSATLPRRGRTTIDGAINGTSFRALLEPDGRKSHWLRIDNELLKAADVTFGDDAEFEIWPVDLEPEPEIPADLHEALIASPESQATWGSTTAIARVDWIHWITSAKQEQTRTKRINDACEMLASGKKRVCCFDPSGFYSKAFCAPETAD